MTTPAEIARSLTAGMKASLDRAIALGRPFEWQDVLEGKRASFRNQLKPLIDRSLVEQVRAISYDAETNKYTTRLYAPTELGLQVRQILQEQPK